LLRDLATFRSCLFDWFFLFNSFGFSTWMVMSSMNNSNFVSSFPIFMHLNLFFCLIASAGTFSTMLAKRIEGSPSSLISVWNCHD
jgi:hypothetical protein